MIFVPAISTPTQERRGIVLLVVMALLTLFSAVGLSFVFYAEAESTIAAFSADGGRKMVPDVDPELLLAYYLGQLIYDVDDQNGLYSAMRGHSLARTMYGYNYPGTSNVNPYNGVGRLHTGGAGMPVIQNKFGAAADDYLGINYTYYSSDGFCRAPEKYNSAPVVQNPPPYPFPGTYVGTNVSYTYPDLNNMFLGAVRGSDGAVLAPSFFRSWTGIGSLDPSNANWGAGASAWTKYLTLRPLPAYNTNFPAPEDGGGDVKNLPFGPGTVNPVGGYFNNDSIWMDLGFPVQIAPNGQKFKPLFAALIIDLDGKVNVNVHGNNRAGVGGAPATIHASNQGFGPGEVNLSQILSNPDWLNLLNGNAIFSGRPSTATTALPQGPLTNVPGPNNKPFPPYSMTNPDGIRAQLAGAAYKIATPYSNGRKYLIPGEGGNGNPAYFGYPNFDSLTYHYFDIVPPYVTNGDTFTRTNNWMIYNSFSQAPFAWSDLEALLRYGDTGSPAMSSALFALSPQSFAVAKARRLVTTHSFGLGRPGASAWLWATPNAAYNTSLLWTPPQGVGAVGFPTFPTSGPNGEFGSDYRGIISALNLDLSNRMSLNRLLPDYPPVDANGRITNYSTAAIIKAFNAAQGARTQLATDIFNRLCWVTTGGFVNPSAGKSYWYTPGGTAAPGTDISDKTVFSPAQYNALEWLAQLAVNIVDYIDNDSYITPFNWDPSTPNDATSNPDKWVYGTELPRLVVNEAYVEVDNDTVNDPMGKTNFQVNLWAELLCPLPSAAPAERLQVPAAVAAATGPDVPYPVYKLAVQTGAAASFGDQTLGTPTLGTMVLEVTDFTDPNAGPRTISPIGTSYNGAVGGTQGFFVVGPKVSGAGVLPTSIQEGPTAITNASNVAGMPITITTGSTTGLYTGAKVIVSGVQGNTAANNSTAGNPATWTIANLQATSFDLVNSTPNGAYTSGGTWVLADYFDSKPSAMSYSVGNGTPLPPTVTHNMILRRLACPNMPPNPYVAGVLQYPNLPYNPYVTVDYVNAIPAYAGVNFLNGAAPPTATPFQNRFTYGRNQPYAATQFMNAPGHPITNATNAAPIQITSSQHGFKTGDSVFITGIVGNMAPNNTAWTVTFVDANNFTLNGSTGNGNYTSGGTAFYADRPQNTLFRHNGIEASDPTLGSPSAPFITAAQGQTIKLPFDWLVHMDRFLISPMEILHTSGYPPYKLTQQFMTLPVTTTPAQNQTFQHIAPWSGANANSARIYRLFSYLTVDSRATGVSSGGRIPGQINVNSIWDIETFMALCDPNKASTFQSADVQAIFTAMTTNVPGARTPSGIPGANDRPFRSFATGFVPTGDPQNPQGLGIGDTLLGGVFDVPPNTVTNGRPYNPFVVKELLTKISTNLTTRSNTFAVFLTVGFFAAQDTDSAGNPLLPAVLGAEIGKAEGRNIRHRMFALIDRSELRVMDVDATTGNALMGTSVDSNGNAVAINPVSPWPISGNVVTQSTPVTATVNLSSNKVIGSNGATFTLLANQTYTLEVDTGSGNDETVSATMNAAGTAFTATFYKNHPATFRIVGRGNPGPATRYNMRNDTRVVPYFSIIE
jgi:hypothetical protein